MLFPCRQWALCNANPLNDTAPDQPGYCCADLVFTGTKGPGDIVRREATPALPDSLQHLVGCNTGHTPSVERGNIGDDLLLAHGKPRA